MTDLRPGAATLNPVQIRTRYWANAEKSANFTAENHAEYIITGTCTVTDPTPAAGHGYRCLIINGTATIGGVAYSTPGVEVTSYYHSGAWVRDARPTLDDAHTWTAAQTFTAPVTTQRSSDNQVTFQTYHKRSAALASQYKVNFNSQGAGGAFFWQVLDAADVVSSNALWYDYANKRFGFRDILSPESSLHVGGAITASGTGADGRYIRSVYLRGASGSDAVQLQGRAGGTGGWVASITTTTLTGNRTVTLPDADIVASGSASALTSGRVPYATTGGLLTDSAGMTYDGTSLTLTGALTVPNGTAAAPGIRLTSEASGLYRVSATSLGFSVAGTAAASLTSAGAFASGGSMQAGTTLGVGTSPSTAIGINVTQTALAGASQYGHLLSVTATSAATSVLQMFTCAPATAAASFTCSQVQGFRYQNVNIGSTSAVTTQYAIRIDALSGATTNYAFSSAGAGLVQIGDTTASTSTTTGSLTTAGGLGVAKAVYAGESILSVGATHGVGYGTGAGGTVTQATSRTTGVTINKVCGQITLVSAAGTASWQSFTVTNSAVATTDVIKVCQDSGTDKYMIHVTAVGAGSFEITYATTGGTTTEQPVFNFAVIKAVTA